MHFAGLQVHFAGLQHLGGDNKCKVLVINKMDSISIVCKEL